LALCIDTSSELSDDANLLVGTEPVGSCYETLGANGCRDTDSRRAGAVTLQESISWDTSFYVECRQSTHIEILVHLVDKLVLGIGK
jgi:hypothetical protein